LPAGTVIHWLYDNYRGNRETNRHRRRADDIDYSDWLPFLGNFAMMVGIDVRERA
jgi:hypothetical protein